MAINTRLPDLSPARDRFKTTITLPSSGYVDTKAFPNGVLTVYPWTADLDEWVIKRHGSNASKNTMLHDVFPKLCDLNGCPPDKFLLSEATLVWLVSRSIRSHQKAAFQTACPECGVKTELTVTIPDDLERTGEKPADYAGYEAVTLQDSTDTVQLSPLSVGKSRAALDRPAGSIYADSVSMLAAMIHTVNGGRPDSMSEACQYVTALSPYDHGTLSKFAQDLNPGVSTRLEIECDACKHNYQHAIQFTDSFFR